MYMPRRTLKWEATVLAALALLTARGGTAQAPTFATLYSFESGSDGSGPNGLVLGKNGALYGTTFAGGANTCGNVGPGYLCGTVFMLSPAKGAAWTKTVLYSFNGADGALPSPSAIFGSGASLVFGSNEALYGTTELGGSNDSSGSGFGGTVFELAPPATAAGEWTGTVIYSLSGSFDAPHAPYGGVAVGPDGGVYGTASSNHYDQGVPAGGTVFALRPPEVQGGSWTEHTLLSLWPQTSMGYSPAAAPVFAGGSLYGTTTYLTYLEGCGSVYKLSPPVTGSGAWTWMEIYNFDSGGGCTLVAPLTVGPGGVLYGTTFVGGAGTACSFNGSGCGTVFQLTPPATPGGAWAETVIYSFTGTDGDGAYPAAGVVLGKNGVLYGTTTTSGGGATSACPFYGVAGCGTMFELTPPTTTGGAWTETILHSFTGENGEGSYPGPLVLNADGVLYGPTWSGGAAGAGTIFALKP
jgi:hypothetical protein